MNMTDYQVLRGQVTSWKILKSENPSLLLIKIQSGEKIVMAILAHKIYDFIYQIPQGSQLEFFGHYNNKKQFVIQKYLVRHKAQKNEALPRHLTYPHSKIHTKE